MLAALAPLRRPTDAGLAVALLHHPRKEGSAAGHWARPQRRPAGLRGRAHRDDPPAPDQGSLCRWLSRAVESGQVCREGSGRRNDPFRYWLPQREEFLRPQGGSAAALQAWNARCVEEAFARLERTSAAIPTQQTPVLANAAATGVAAVAAVQAAVQQRVGVSDRRAQDLVGGLTRAGKTQTPPWILDKRTWILRHAGSRNVGISGTPFSGRYGPTRAGRLFTVRGQSVAQQLSSRSQGYS